MPIAVDWDVKHQIKQNKVFLFGYILYFNHTNYMCKACDGLFYILTFSVRVSFKLNISEGINWGIKIL